jgi:phosphate uptake regulator
VAIGDQSVQIAELAIKLGNAKIAEEFTQLLLRLHRVAFEAHETAFKALFARDIALAEAVRNGRQTIVDLYAEVESALRKEHVEIAPHILAAASAISRIYDHSKDIADLIMPKIS